MMRTLRWLFLLPALFLLSCDDRETSSALPTAPEAGLGFRIRGVDTLPTVDSVRIHVAGGGVEKDTVLPWEAKRGGIKALPAGVKYTATLQGLKLVNGRKVVAWSATDTVTLTDSKDRKVIDMAPEIKVLQPLVKSDFAALALFAGVGDTLIYGLPGDTATLAIPGSDAADSVYLDGVAVPLTGRSFLLKVGLDALPLVTIVARDGMSRSWTLAPKALGEPLQLAVEAGRTLGRSGEILVDSMGYVVPADRSPLTIAGVKALRRNDTAVEVNNDTARVVLAVPPAGSSRTDTLVGTDRLGRKDTILVRSVRAADTAAPKVGFSVSPSQSIVAGQPATVRVTFTVAEDSLGSFKVDGTERGEDSSVFVVEKTLDATEGWSFPWEAVDRSGGRSSGTVVVSRYDADVKDTVPPTLDSMSLDVASWKSGGKTWIKGGDVTLKVFAKDDRGGGDGIAGVWLRGTRADGSKDSLPLTKGNGFWSTALKVERDTLLELVARDQAGNPSAVFDASVRVDALAPVITASDSLLCGAGAVTIGFSLQETGVGLLAESLVLLVDGTPSSLQVTNVGEGYSIDFPGMSSSGRHMLGFKACDRLRNCSEDSMAVRIDVDGPEISVLPASGTRVVADSSGGGHALLTVQDPSGVKSVTAVSGSTSIEAVLKAGEGWRLEIPSFPEGEADWSLMATDSLGNVRSASFTTYRVKAPTATAEGRVASGTTVTLACGENSKINVNGEAQNVSSFSWEIKQQFSVSAYCFEGSSVRSVSKSFSWTVAALENSEFVSLGETVADSAGKLDLVVTVKNAASINTAELQPNLTGTTLATVKGELDLAGETVTFRFANMAEGSFSYTLVVRDKDNDAWPPQNVSLRRVAAPEKGRSPSASIGMATIQCQFGNDILYLDGTSQKSYMAEVLITRDTSILGRCVDAKGHSSRTAVLSYALAGATDSMLLLGGEKLSPEKHLVVVLAGPKQERPRLVIGDRANGVLYGFELDPKDPWKNYESKAASSTVTVPGLDTLLVAKGHDGQGSSWLVVRGTNGVQLVESPKNGVVLKTALVMPGTLLVGTGAARLMAAVYGDVVHLTWIYGTVLGNASNFYDYSVTDASFSVNSAYAKAFDAALGTTGKMWVGDLGLSAAGPVMGWVDKEQRGQLVALESSGKETAGAGSESFAEGASGIAKAGWQVLYPQPGKNGIWSLTPRNLAYGKATSGTLNGPLFEGTITASKRPVMAFGAAQGWLALPGGNLWRFNLDGTAVEKGSNASKVAELAATEVSSGMVDGYGHAWFSHVGTDGIWLLLRASP